MRDHLRAGAAKGNPIHMALYRGPDLPPAAEHVWKWFRRLSARRGSSGYGPLPIGWAELDAWSRLTATRPAVWEVELLEELDLVWLAVVTAKSYRPPLLDELEGAQS